ncbi:MAG TPA: biopolymer transporter ExbD [Candidatus Krumholzibacteria bacterium]|nr:biopolymer transporter ExbD [Candidatus Krumholzibacteria bacterium]
MGANPNTFNGGASPNHEVNMVPLIDVSLVLVVMLLLATPLAFESRIDVANASRTAKQAEKVDKSERVEITVISEDSVRVNRRIVARAQLGESLTPLLETSAERGVRVACAPRVSHGAFVDVLDQAKMSGAVDISVIER